MSFELPSPRGELLWYAIDFDGTLATGVWTPESSGREIGVPIKENINKLWEVVRAGFKISVHTARGWEHYEAIESWLNYYEVPFRRIVCGKILAHRYVDDRAISAFDDTWLP